MLRTWARPAAVRTIELHSRAADHLEGLTIPQVFVSGDRDRLGPIDLVAAVTEAVPNGSLEVIEGGMRS